LTVDESPEDRGTGQLANVHKCFNCGHTIALEQIDMKTITSGVITCTECGKSGPVNIEIVPKP
jgi:transcription elongation factor Elf1